MDGTANWAGRGWHEQQFQETPGITPRNSCAHLAACTGQVAVEPPHSRFISLTQRAWGDWGWQQPCHCNWAGSLDVVLLVGPQGSHFVLQLGVWSSQCWRWEPFPNKNAAPVLLSSFSPGLTFSSTHRPWQTSLVVALHLPAPHREIKNPYYIFL